MERQDIFFFVVFLGEIIL